MSAPAPHPLSPPPLSLYVHIPWCVQKCPYCDFNSHRLAGGVPEQAYIAALLDDLQQDLADYDCEWSNRPLQSIFIGGGTPSLFSPAAIGQLLAGIKQQLPWQEDIEITMEANPGTLESQPLAAYQQQGVTRISIGVQSFAADKLQALGRIHNPQEAIAAAQSAQAASLNSFNLDLMHGLPGQSPADALADLQQAIALAPPHLSWYQLTIEPNTPFYQQPPTLPDEDDLWAIYQQGHQLLLDAGYQQYETSAYALPGYRCQHNLNYWRFGDYLAIGCGAHSKITLPNAIIRSSKIRQPQAYLQAHGIQADRPLIAPQKSYLQQRQQVAADELAFEYFMNRFRLLEPCPRAEFSQLTGLSEASIGKQLAQAIDLGYLQQDSHHWQVTARGQRFLNDLLTIFC